MALYPETIPESGRAKARPTADSETSTKEHHLESSLDKTRPECQPVQDKDEALKATEQGKAQDASICEHQVDYCPEKEAGQKALPLT